MLTLQESIRPSADLRNHYAEISKQCKENKEAVIITVNGRGDTVALSYEEYKNMKARIELLEVLAEAEDDVKNEINGRYTPFFCAKTNAPEANTIRRSKTEMSFASKRCIE